MIPSSIQHKFLHILTTLLERLVPEAKQVQARKDNPPDLLGRHATTSKSNIPSSLGHFVLCFLLFTSLHCIHPSLAPPICAPVTFCFDSLFASLPDRVFHWGHLCCCCFSRKFQFVLRLCVYRLHSPALGTSHILIYTHIRRTQSHTSFRILKSHPCLLKHLGYCSHCFRRIIVTDINTVSDRIG